MRLCFALAFVPAALAVAACESPREPLAPEFGAAVRQNAVVHIIDPTPTHERAQPRGDGARAARVIEDYRQGGGEATQTVTTTD